MRGHVRMVGGLAFDPRNTVEFRINHAEMGLRGGTGMLC